MTAARPRAASVPPGDGPRSRAARAAFRSVRGYQSLMARVGRPSPCRFVPTCSMYALDAYEYHGFWRGTCLTIGRIARCHPWGRTGWDPVPALRHEPPSGPAPEAATPRPGHRRRKGSPR